MHHIFTEPFGKVKKNGTNRIKIYPAMSVHPLIFLLLNKSLHRFSFHGFCLLAFCNLIKHLDYRLRGWIEFCSSPSPKGSDCLRQKNCQYEQYQTEFGWIAIHSVQIGFMVIFFFTSCQHRQSFEKVYEDNDYNKLSLCDILLLPRLYCLIC